MSTRCSTPVGFAVGRQTNLVLRTDDMMSQVGYEARPAIQIHEEGLRDTFLTRITKHGLLVTEICPADGEKSGVA